MPENRSFYLKMSTALRDRLRALAPALQIRVRRGNTSRDAFMSEILGVAAEHLAGCMEAGEDVLRHTTTVAGAVQNDVVGGSIVPSDIVARAPLSSLRAYAELSADPGGPGGPTTEQVDALQADAALIVSGERVMVRGSVFQTDNRLVGLPGIAVRTRSLWVLVKVIPVTVGDREMFDNGELSTMRYDGVYVHAYDLVPADVGGG